MPKTNRRTLFSGAIIFFVFSLLIVSCETTSSVTPAPETGNEISNQPTPTNAPDRVVLISPGDANPLLLSGADTLLRELAAGSGLEFEIRNQISQDEITPDMRVVVFLRKPDNLGSLSASAPNTQFVSLVEEDWNPSENVSVIRLRDDHTAFIAGYLSAILAPNFRTGALLSSDQPQFNDAFRNGVQYYCGTCSSVVYPLNSYPAISVQPADSPPQTWQAAFNEINTNAVNVLYLADAAVSPDLVNAVSSSDVALIGTTTPPDSAGSKWIATVYSDGVSPIREIWQDILNGSGGLKINADVKIMNYQYIQLQEGLAWLSNGKLNLVRKVTSLLRDGLINPLSVIQ